jgi:hypothetical protein
MTSESGIRVDVLLHRFSDATRTRIQTLGLLRIIELGKEISGDVEASSHLVLIGFHTCESVVIVLDLLLSHHWVSPGNRTQNGFALYTS